MHHMDVQLFFLINHGMANGLFDLLMPLLTHQGYLLVLPVMPYVIYRGWIEGWRTDRRLLLTAGAAIVIAAAAVLLSDLLVNHLKALIARPRPCQALEGVRLLIDCPRSFSLPSSHAATSFAFALPLFLLTRQFLPLRWRIYPLSLAAAIACSRPYLGVHYPSDIAAGALLGAVVAAVPCWLFWKVLRRERKE